MVKITFDVSGQDAIYLIRLSEMMERARARGELSDGRGYLSPSTRERVGRIQNIIDGVDEQ